MHYNGVFISTDNSKLGRIYNISLPPGLSCGKDVPCRRDCYARHIWRRKRLHVEQGWSLNWYHYQTCPRNYFDAITEFLREKARRYFRWHVSGDIVDSDYWQGMLRVASALPETRFLCFTKRHDLVRKSRVIPGNLTVVASMWPGWGTPPRKFPRAWCRHPKQPDPRIPKTAKRCPGHCDTCHKCWNLAPKDDVVFELH
jgi:hypothetical protein